MDEAQVRQIIQEELANFLRLDRFIFQKHLQVFDGRHIQVGKTTGTKIGTEGGTGGQKLGFFNKTPTTQPAAISDPSGGDPVDAQARSAINAIIDALQALGLLNT